MVQLGSPAPEFALPATDGRTVKKADFTGRPLLVMFICNHCPYVKHIADDLARITKDYAAKGVAVVGISSNDVRNYPGDSPELMKKEHSERGYGFPYLFDESQAVARSYHAQCTPDFFLYDGAHKLAYRGQLDGSRPGNGEPVTGTDLTAAVNAVVAGQLPSEHQKPSIGCNIKWK